MSDDAHLRAVIESRKARRVLVAHMHVLENGENSNDEPDVHRVIDIPLDFTGKGDYFKSPIGWRDFRVSNEPLPYVWFLQLMLLLHETTSQGGYQCNIDPVTNGKLYQTVVTASARCVLNIAKESDYRLRSKYTSLTHYVDLRFAYDVEYEAKKIVFDMAQEKKKQQEKRKKAKANKKQKKKQTRMIRRDVTDDYLAWRRTLELGDELGVNMCDGVAESVVQGALFHDEEEDVEEEDVEEKFPPKIPYEGPNRVAKMTFTVTPIPAADDSTNIVGMLARFLIRDKGINPGMFFDEVLRNAHDRIDNMQRNGRTKFEEKFINYESMLFSHHPAGRSTTRENYAQCVKHIWPEVVGLHFKGSIEVYLRELDYINPEKPTHIYNVFTTERALSKLAEIGGDTRLIGNPGSWYDRVNGIAKFPARSLRTWKYLPEQTFFHHPDDAGLNEQYLPHVDASRDFLRRLVSGADMTRYCNTGRFEDEDEGEEDERVSNAIAEVQHILRNNIRFKRSQLTGTKLIHYTTNNEFVHKAVEAQIVYDRLAKLLPAHSYDTLVESAALIEEWGVNDWKTMASPDLLRRIKEYDVYRMTLGKTQESLMQVFTTLWRVDGDINNLPVSRVVRNILTWYRDVHQTDLPHMTREYVTRDPALDPFGNTMIQQLDLFIKFAHILQPIICVLAEGLFSCYDQFTQLCFNMLLHGRFDSGKTHTAINTLHDYSTIPHSVVKVSLATDAADTTGNHVYDEIEGVDECPAYITSTDEAKKNPKLESKMKLRLTANQLVTDVFKYVKLPSGESVRWNERQHSDHVRAGVFITNNPVEARVALSSRMYRITMKQTRTAASDNQGDVAPVLFSDGRTWLHINQFLSCCAKKAAAVGAIMPQIQMQLFERICNKAVNYLKTWGYITTEIGSRPLDIMRPYVRQLVYKMAIRYAWDLPRSPNYKKPFATEQIAAIQPFLYVTVEQIYWAMTACATEYVDNDMTNVMKAMIDESGSNFVTGESNYSLYESDTADSIKFRIRSEANKDFNKTSIEGSLDRFLIDINYLALDGTFEQICTQLAARTDPQLTSEDVGSILKRLSSQLFRPERGGFAPVPMGTFQKWHKKDANGNKANHQSCPAIYDTDKCGSAAVNRERNEYDMPVMGDGHQFHIVDMSEIERYKKLYFIPQAANKYRQDIILEALDAATICSTTRPGKTLIGFTDPKEPMRVQIHVNTTYDIDRYIENADAKAGFKMVRGKPEYKDKTVPANRRPVSRREGVVFNLKAGIDEREHEFILAAPLAPKPVGDDTWKQQYRDGLKLMTKTRDVVPDLNRHSAMLQHIACGRPLDEPVRDPQWIMEHLIGPEHQGMDYPNLQREIRDDLEKVWTSSYDSKRDPHDRSFDDKRARSNMSTRERNAEIDRLVREARSRDVAQDAPRIQTVRERSTVDSERSDNMGIFQGRRNKQPRLDPALLRDEIAGRQQPRK